MPANITDADTFTATVQAPADGDTANGATFQLAPQDLADRTRWLYNRRSPTAYSTFGDENKTVTVGTDWHMTVVTSAARVVTLQHSTAPIPYAGQRLRVTAYSGASGTVTFKREDATPIAVLTGTGAGQQVPAEFVYTGSAWVVSMVEDTAKWSGLVRN